MALIYFEGADVAPVTSPPWLTVPIRFTPGRNGTSHCIGVSGNPSELDIGVNLATVIVGVAMQVPVALASDSILDIQDGATVHLRISITTAGAFEIRRGDGTLLGTSTVGLIQADAWFYVELKATIHDSAGIAILRVNGITAINLTNVDTRNGANAQVNRIGYGGIDGPAGTILIDDLYVCDTTGALNNDFLGDVTVEPIYPNAAGQYTEWTPSTGNNWECVDEPGTPNDDTDYVASGTVGQRDMYNMSTLVITSGEIKGLKTVAHMKKTDVGTRGVRLMLRSGTTESDSTLEFGLNTSYARHESQIYETNPDTSAPFTITQVNAIQLGARVTT